MRGLSLFLHFVKKIIINSSFAQSTSLRLIQPSEKGLKLILVSKLFFFEISIFLPK